MVLRMTDAPNFQGGAESDANGEDSPQTRHKPKRTETDNGGFLRVAADRSDVAKNASSDPFVSVSISQVLDLPMTIPAGVSYRRYINGLPWQTCPTRCIDFHRLFRALANRRDRVVITESCNH
jgi:hypothetical protein